MKLLELDLRAFGPFTDRRLDFGVGAAGLHLVFGPNEAGKSSALRALRAWLFGIPERTRDDFRHAKPDLVVGGRLCNRQGESLTFLRRKRRKDPLVDPDGRPLPEEVLKPFLGEVDERLFQRLFGIDHQTLVSGGQALLEERGRAAEALFGTALGAAKVRRLLDRLDRECQDLFLPRASKPIINALIVDYADAEQRLRDASLAARDWEHASRTFEQATADLAAMDREIERTTRERNRLERIRRTLPELVGRARLQEQLRALGDGPVLPDDAAPRRETATAQRLLAADARDKARHRLQSLQAVLRELADRLETGLLQEADSIEQLRERLGSHRKAARDHAVLVGELHQHRAAAVALLTRVRPDMARDPTSIDMERLTYLLSRRRRAADLGAGQASLQDVIARTGSDLAAIRERLRRRSEALGAQPPPASSLALEQALDAARRAGDLDRAILELEAAVAAQGEACRQGIAALGVRLAAPTELSGLPLPEEETVRRFAAQWGEIAELRRTLVARRTEALEEETGAIDTLRRQELTGTVPSEDDLVGARHHRDLGWRLLKAIWLEGVPPTREAASYGGGVPLPDAFENAILATDELADRLRRESQRVHDKAAAEARLESARQRLRLIDRDLAELDAHGERVREEWRRLWEPVGVTPLPPAEMQAWLARTLRVKEQVRQAAESESSLAIRVRLRAALAEGLRRALGQPTESDAPPVTSAGLAPLIEEAEARQRFLEQEARRRAALEQEIADLEERIRELVRARADAEEAQSRWRSDWTSLLAELGLPADATPGQVSDDLEAIAEALKRIEAAHQIDSRIRGIERDAAEFARQAEDCFRRVAPDLPGRPLEEAIQVLHGRLLEQRAVATRVNEIEQQVAAAQEEIRLADYDVAAADRVLADLCRQANCENPDELPLIEERRRTRRQLVDRLEEVESRLIRAGDGLDIESLRRDAADVDQDQAVARLGALDARLEGELRPAHRALIERKADAERTLRSMGGGDAAAAIAEEAEQILAAIRHHAERYVTAKLAARLLRDEIERYRRLHSDPILARTSAHFANLTGRSFRAVETDFDESDHPILVGVRDSGERLGVEAMSTGTRDQLYLALRLANLEHDLETAEPMPFIVDDILIQFDDARARATLEALAEFSSKTQVILFTHHGRDIEQALALDPEQERIRVHRLA